MFICVAPRGAGTVASPSANALPEEEEPDEGLRPVPSGLKEDEDEEEEDRVPPGRTGRSFVGREKEGDREEEAEGLRAFVAVFAAREGDGRLPGVNTDYSMEHVCDTR